MRTPTFAVAMTMAAALHAEPIGPSRPEPACKPSHRDQRELKVINRLGMVFVYRPCIVEDEDEARDLRHLAQTIDESAMSGVLALPRREQPTPCLPADQPRTVGYGTGKSSRVVYYRECNEAEARAWYERQVRAVRERLGDPGRH